MDELTSYTREILADVSEAKRIGGKRLWHLPSDRISAADMRKAGMQLIGFSIHAYRSGNMFHVSW